MQRRTAIWLIGCCLAGPLLSTVCAALPDERPELAFDSSRDFDAWQEKLGGELRRILALPSPPHAELRPVVRRVSETDEYTMERVEFQAEPGETVPGYLLVPRAGEPPFPTMICLQGHAPGMHISIGRASTEKEEALIAGGRDIAIQAVRHGWAALAIEQRAFGERAEDGISCGNRALFDLLKGKPLTGQRVYDVMRAVDFIAQQPELDVARVGSMGNSAGGTISFYAACVEPRIRLAVVSCSFGTFESTWLYKQHCACGYLPGLLKVADMPDLAGLITPRHLILVAGKQDYLARFDGVEQGYKTARQCFTAAGHPDRVHLVVGEGGHQFYPDLAWPVIQRAMRYWKSEEASTESLFHFLDRHALGNLVLGRRKRIGPQLFCDWGDNNDRADENQRYPSWPELQGTNGEGQCDGQASIPKYQRPSKSGLRPSAESRHRPRLVAIHPD